MTQTSLLPFSLSKLKEEPYPKTIFGFWIYLMTDCILFSVLFATYIVLKPNTNGGPSAKELFDLPFALTETLILLTSSFTSGLALLALNFNQKKRALFWFAATFLLGVSFLGMELTEFSRFVKEGNSWQRSGFLSSFFALVGTHGLHITTGLLWMLVMMFQTAIKGITPSTFRRNSCLVMFWHFLDVIWIFIFTIVYLMGVI